MVSRKVMFWCVVAFVAVMIFWRILFGYILDLMSEDAIKFMLGATAGWILTTFAAYKRPDWFTVPEVVLRRFPQLTDTQQSAERFPRDDRL